jgi:hypothetical protein
MKAIILAWVIVVGAVGVEAEAEAEAEADSPIPVSVLSFKNKTGSMSCSQDWFWWQDHLGSAFQDMLKLSAFILVRKE